VWDVPSSSEVARMTHEGDVNEVAFSPDVKYLATASDDKTACVQVWQPEGHIE
jgi:WD40 repeat protein